MSIKVTCIYYRGMCTCYMEPEDRCVDWMMFEYGEPDCAWIENQIVIDDKGEERILRGSCKWLSVEQSVIHKKVSSFEWTGGWCVTIGKQTIHKDLIKYLAIDYGEGTEVLIDERKRHDD